MRKPVATVALMLAWLCANGALLDLVQVFAWSRMFVGYSQTMTVGVALRETFDPAKPCELCVGVAEAKEGLSQKPLPVTIERSADKQLILALHTPGKLVIASQPECWPAVVARAGPMRSERVPVPPPRA